MTFSPESILCFAACFTSCPCQTALANERAKVIPAPGSEHTIPCEISTAIPSIEPASAMLFACA